MPRSSVYAKDPEKYKRKIKARRYKEQFDKQGFFVPEEFLKASQGYDTVDYGEELKRHTKTKTLAKALHIITKEIQDKTFYTIDGYSFVPLIVYEKYFAPIVVVLTSWDEGCLRVNEWIPILKETYPYKDGYSVYLNRINEPGVDVLVRKDGMPYMAIELTNYSQTSYISFEDTGRYVDNLNFWDKYNALKVIVVSFPENLKHKKQPDLWEEFPKNNICIKVMRRQAKLSNTTSSTIKAFI